MAENFNMDAYSPQQIAERVDNIGVTKARLPLLSTTPRLPRFPILRPLASSPTSASRRQPRCKAFN